MKITIALVTILILFAMIRFIYQVKSAPSKIADLWDPNPYLDSPFIDKPSNAMQKANVWLFLFGAMIIVYFGVSQLLFWLPQSMGFYNEDADWIQMKEYVAGIIAFFSLSVFGIIEKYATQITWQEHRLLLVNELESLVLLPVDELKNKQKEYCAKEADEKIDWRRRIMYFRLDRLLQEKIERYERQNKLK